MLQVHSTRGISQACAVIAFHNTGIVLFATEIFNPLIIIFCNLRILAIQTGILLFNVLKVVTSKAVLSDCFACDAKQSYGLMLACKGENFWLK